MAQDQPHETRSEAERTISSPSPPSVADDAETTTSPPLPRRPANQQHHHQQPLPRPYHHNNGQIPYAPYPYPQTQPGQQPYSVAQPMRMLPPQSQAYIATRLGLTVFSSVLAIIMIALSSIFLADSGYAEGITVVVIPIAVAAIIWNTAELITYCMRLRKEAQRGIHPGAHVALHLLFWLAGILATLLTVLLYVSAENVLTNCREAEEGDDNSSSSTGISSEYNDGYYGINNCRRYQPLDYYFWNYLPTIRGLLAIVVLFTINSFVLFVLACIDTHKRNMLKPAGYVMPAPSPGAPALPPGMVYAAPPTGYYAQYPPMQMMPVPQHAHSGMAVPPLPVHGTGTRSGTGGAPALRSEKGKETTQNYSNLAGFYAPPNSSAAPVPAADYTRTERTPEPSAAAGPSNV